MWGLLQACATLFSDNTLGLSGVTLRDASKGLAEASPSHGLSTLQICQILMMNITRTMRKSMLCKRHYLISWLYLEVIVAVPVPVIFSDF